MKCGVDVGASTDNSSAVTMIVYAASPKMLPDDKVVTLYPSIFGNGATAKTETNSHVRLKSEALVCERDVKWCTGELLMLGFVQVTESNVHCRLTSVCSTKRITLAQI